MRRAVLLLAILLLAGARAQAQSGFYGGFVGGGRGGTDNPLLDPKWTVAFGYQTLFGVGGGVQVGVRSSLGYSRFRPDVEAFVDSVGATTGEADGGTTTITNTGVDLVLGVRLRRVALYGYHGIHYFRDHWDPMTLETDRGDFEFSSENRNDFGSMWGAGVFFDLFNGQGLYAEWFRGGGYDDRMLETRGVRFGLVWGW
jgi:hypothetical protein